MNLVYKIGIGKNEWGTLSLNIKLGSIVLQVALTLHGFTLHDPHFTRGLYFFQMDSHYVMHYTISSLYTVKKPLSKY